MLNLHRDKQIVRREPGRDGKILCDHRQDGNDEVHRLYVRRKKKEKEKRKITWKLFTAPGLYGDGSSSSAINVNM